MPTSDLPEGTLKALLKDALAEALHEQRDLLHEIVEDALSEMALAEAIREVEASERRMGRQPRGFAAIEGQA
ncbi:MAG TPA: hypothetical protein VD962_04765 [Rubricoccaceae bacterium]|nr:hypothetical protein [Rubricoccaceae bacterium]